MYKKAPLTVLVVLFIGLLGCETPPPQVSTTTFSSDVAVADSATTNGGTVMLGGEGIRIHIFSSDKHYNYKKEAEVLPAFRAFINSGLHEIVAVRTIYGPNGHLLKAEVYYRLKTPRDSTPS
jgi:hypothetical protein